MPFFIGFTLFQALFIIHVIKNRKEGYWIFLLLFIPIAGGLAYLVVEVLPDLRRSSPVKSVSKSLSNVIHPTKRLEELRFALDESDTVSNRMRYADELCSHGDMDKAIELYRSCLRDQFKDDDEIKKRLGSALVRAGRWKEAIDVYSSVADLTRVADRLLHLRARSETEEYESVIQDWEKLYNGSLDPEVGYYFASIVQPRDPFKAGAIMTQMEKNLKFSKGTDTPRARLWLKRARAELT